MNPKTRILEDDEEDRDFIRHGLAAHGLVDTVDYTLHATSDELRAVINDKTRVVVLDYKLNEAATGLDVMLELRKSKAKGDLFIVILSGQAYDEAVIMFVNSGADFFIRKEPSLKYLDVLADVIKHGITEVDARVAEKEQAAKDREEKEQAKAQLRELLDKIDNGVKNLTDETRNKRTH